CNIYFYLEDDTIHVSEPKYANSGIPQGTLIRRHRIPMSSSNKSQHYTISDLNVDKEVTFYGRTFKIVGCDHFTREFLTNISISVPASGEFPSDPYQIQRAELLSRLKPTRPYVKNTALKQFLENDRRVLRFYCVWDDTNTVFGDVRHMVVHYYLSDDTVDIHESIPSNSGRPPNSMFLRRCRLPKHATPGTSSLSPTIPDAYYSDKDFTLGAVLHLNGRPFVICDCDEFTKEYYREKYGLETFDPVRPEDYEETPIEDPVEELAKQTRVWSMVPDTANHPVHEVTKKAFQKTYDGLFLRYLAVLKTSKQVDCDRKFVISLYLADDSVSVFEPHQRNTGIKGGKFLEKNRVKKPDGVSFYESADFYIGNLNTVDYTKPNHYSLRRRAYIPQPRIHNQECR
ncbi:EF-hand domain-containing member C2, partial [Rhizoclosmatium hyalinum]